MKLKIKGEDIELLYLYRTILFFEDIAGHNLDFANMTQKDIMNLFYANVYATLQKMKKETITMLELLDIIDDNGGERCVLQFASWFIENYKKELEILNDINVEDKPVKKTKEKVKAKN